MLKAIVIGLVGCLLSFAAVAQSPAIYGNWHLGNFSQGPYGFDINLKTEPGKITMYNVCTLSGKTAMASVTANAQYSDTEIVVMGQDQKQVNQNGIACSASVVPGRMTYTVSADGKNLTMVANGQTMKATRK